MRDTAVKDAAPSTPGEAMLAEIPPPGLLHRLFGLHQRLLWNVYTDQRGQQFTKFDGWPIFVNRGWSIACRYYVLDEGIREPSPLGRCRVSETWKILGRKDPRS